ncbi:MAG: hypothetical protein ISS16_06165 [Ignavibacteria bacterium]|nr:hypothetical protein [Bacteroidota bacterium]MBL7128553.1 hypothetical protein [Ignavibacteria bacterium]
MEDFQDKEATTKQAITFKKEKIIKGITCPACSGELDLREGVITFNCKYCGTLLTTKGESGALKFYVPKVLSRDEAINKAYNWLGKGLAKARGLKANSKIEDVFLVYIPYWRVRADVVGWIFGQEKRTRTVNNRVQTYYVDVERKIQRTYDNTFAACDISELGVQKVNLAGDELHPVDFETLQQEGMIFNIISSESKVSESAKQQFVNDARNSARVDRINFEYYDLVRENLSVVYYPLWVTRYNFKNRTYQVVIDGEDGSTCYGKAPGNNLYRAIMGILGIGVGMYLATLFGAFSAIEAFEEGTFVIYILALIFGIIIMIAGYKKFRYGGEVEEGTGIIKKKKKKGTIQVGKTSIDSMAVVKNAGTALVVGSLVGSILRGMRR